MQRLMPSSARPMCNESSTTPADSRTAAASSSELPDVVSQPSDKHRMRRMVSGCLAFSSLSMSVAFTIASYRAVSCGEWVSWRCGGVARGEVTHSGRLSLVDVIFELLVVGCQHTRGRHLAPKQYKTNVVRQFVRIRPIREGRNDRLCRGHAADRDRPGSALGRLVSVTKGGGGGVS